MNAIRYAETFPDTVETGMIVLNPITGQGYIYLNAGWQPFTGTVPYNYEYDFSILINEVDVSLYVKNNTFKISNVLTNAVDTCSFTVFDNDNDLDITQGMEVDVWYRHSSSDTLEKIFGGEISRCPQYELAPATRMFEYNINAVDFSKRINRKLAIETYESEYAGDIIKDLIDSYLSGEFTYTNVQDGDIITKISFNYKPVADCIKELAKLIDYDWYVDENKDIHFISSETNTAPYQLTESISTTGHYKDLNISVDKSQLRNRVYVRGGTYLSDLYTDEQVADGEATGFLMQYPPRSPITVYVNDVEKTCGIDGTDESGYDFVVNYQEKLIKNLDFATLAADDVLKVTYKYEIEVLTQDDDSASRIATAAIEGNDGIYEYVISDTTIDSLDLAHSRAEAELDRYANAIVKGTFFTDQTGYRSGQLLTIDMEDWGYDTEYMIQRVDGATRGDNKLFYKVTFATSLKGLTEFLKDMWESGHTVVVRENETVADIETLTGETITISDAIDYTTEHISTYLYNDADAMYNMAQYS